jgi:release factor glutamine methyltransferase
MILGEALRSITETLQKAEIDDARIEAELLVGHALGMSRTQLYTEPERPLTAPEARRLKRLVRRRLNREPAAYILGQCGFYGIELAIDRGALIPRPETELLVEEAIKLARHIFSPGEELIIADIGTGCGAIAISLALALPQATIYATDVSTSALRVARANCRRHAVDGRVRLLRGDLLEPLPRPVDIIVANLPYIRTCDLNGLSPEIANFEPGIALAGGEDGLDKIREMLDTLPAKLKDGGCFLLEIGQGQGDALVSLIESRIPEAGIELVQDPAGIDRVAKVIMRSPANSAQAPGHNRG